MLRPPFTLPRRSPSMDEQGATSLCVCVPARNEAARLPRLIDALASQNWPGVIALAVAVNNTTDDSIAVIDRCRQDHRARLAIDITQVDFPAQQAHAGSARRLAMEMGAALLSGDDSDILVSTDADVRPPADWLSNITAAMARGADLVGGRIMIDPDEPLPPGAALLRASLDRYWSKVRAIEDSIDPVAWDAQPRHGDHTGASLAITLRAYRDCGGVPPIACGEDRALVAAAVARGARLVHPDDVWVHVSPRCDGRAAGGMADDMARLVAAGESPAPLLMPDFDHWRARAQWRRRMREQGVGPMQMVRDEERLPPMPHDMPLAILA